MNDKRKKNQCSIFLVFKIIPKKNEPLSPLLKNTSGLGNIKAQAKLFPKIKCFSKCSSLTSRKAHISFDGNNFLIL